MTRSIDELMDIDPLSLSEQDLTDIITYQRQARARSEGAKVKAERADRPKISLEGLFAKKSVDPVKRRI